MAQPKKRTSKTKTGMRRSHLMAKLRRAVNKTSPVRAEAKKAVSAKAAVKLKAASAKKAPAGKTKSAKDRSAGKSSK